MAVENSLHFTSWDYVLFISVFLLSSAIGLYYAYKTSSVNEYMMGNRQMTILPVTASLLATHISAVAIIGTPAEIYNYGGTYLLSLIDSNFASAITASIYLPVFYNLKLTSIFEYLELRFNLVIQRIAWSMYIIQMIVVMAFEIYAPSLILSQATGLGIWDCILTMGFVTTIYTALGGIKAVMWTDVLQLVFMFITILVIVIKGSIEIGGLKHIWQKNLDGGRFNIFNFDLDPTLRYSVWSMLFGNGITTLSKFAVGQVFVQKSLCMPTIKLAKRTLWLNNFGFCIINFLLYTIGFILYAAYWNCDPLNSGKIESRDEILPLFILQFISHNSTGLPGLFVAGIFSSAISSTSSLINCLATITYKQVIETYCTNKLVTKHSIAVIRITALLYGGLPILLIPLIQQLGGIFSAFVSVLSVINGPLFGLFTIGMLFPCVSSKAAGIGTLFGYAIPLWILIGSVVHKLTPLAPDVSIAGCNVTNFNETLYNSTNGLEKSSSDDILGIYKLSFLWYRFVSFVLTLTVGLLATVLFGWWQKEQVDPKLISPIVHKIKNLFASKWQQRTEETVNTIGDSSDLLSNKL